MTLVEKQNLLDSIADRCKVTREMVTLYEGEPFVQPKPGSDYKSFSYESFECVLGKLSKVKGLSKMGFVGNEAHTAEPQ